MKSDRRGKVNVEASAARNVRGGHAAGAPPRSRAPFDSAELSARARVGRCRIVTPIFAVFLFLLQLPAHPAEDDGNNLSSTVDREAARLNDYAQRVEQKAVGIRISGLRYYGYWASAETALPRDEVISQVKALIAALKSGSNPQEQLSRFSERQLSTQVKPKDRYGAVERFEYLQGAGGRKLDTGAGGTLQSRAIYNGKDSKYVAPVGQASIHPSQTNEYMEKFSDFVHTPIIRSLEGLQLTAEGGGRRKLATQRYALTYDASTLFAYEEVFRRPSGSVVVERLQDMPKEVASGVSVPGIAVKIKFYDRPDAEPTAQVVDVYSIVNVLLEESLTAEDFQVAAPAGTRVVDFGTESPTNTKDGPKRHVSTKVARDVDDVVVVASEAAAGLGVQPGARPNTAKSVSWRTALVAINCALLLAAVLWAVSRRRSSAG